MSIFSKIVGTGSYLPKKIVTNADLSKIVDTSDEWIKTRTGILERHYADENQNTSDLAFEAAKEALLSAKIDAKDISAIIVATTTADKTFPSVAIMVQQLLGNKTAYAFDVQAVCAGFIYAITVADSLIKSGSAKNVLVIGADKMSKIIDFKDRATCVLFGDGAGAVILSATDKNPNDGNSGILGSELFSDGGYLDILYCDRGDYIQMKGQELFKHAVEKLSSAVEKVLIKTGIKQDEIDWVVPHQANIRIIQMVSKKLNLSDEKVVKTVEKHANTSAASIPLALDTAVKDGRIKEKDIVVMEAIGGGLAWGATIVRF